jgi:hypothetical protein
MTFERFYKLRIATRVFQVKDLQTTGVLLEWVQSCGYSPDELLLFIKLFPEFDQLERIGYFNPVHSTEQARNIRLLEKKLPKEFRQEVRQVRLENSYAGPLHEGRG